MFDPLPDYPHKFPLVAERDSRKAREAAKGKTLDFRQSELVQWGFPLDCWLPIEIAKQWQSDVYPTNPSPEAITQWETYLGECVSAANVGKLAFDTAQRLSDALAHDRELLRRWQAETAPNPATARQANRPGTGTVKGKRIDERMLVAIRDDNQRVYWSANQWAKDFLACSKTAVLETKTWKEICRPARERERLARGRRLRHRPDSDRP